jgi:hypothetical protein
LAVVLATTWIATQWTAWRLGGGRKEESDNVWTRESEQRFRIVESNPSMIPDHAIIQIWARWPKKMLPEDQPGTLTNLVLKYKAR